MGTRAISILNPLFRLLLWPNGIASRGNDRARVRKRGHLRSKMTRHLVWLKGEACRTARPHIVGPVHNVSEAVEAPCSLENLEVRLEALLTEMEAATGCSDAEAERLLAEWERANVEYTCRRELEY